MSEEQMAGRKLARAMEHAADAVYWFALTCQRTELTRTQQRRNRTWLERGPRAPRQLQAIR